MVVEDDSQRINQSNWAERRVRNVEPISILQFAESDVSINPDPIVSDCNECVQNQKIKIDVDDIQPELDY